MKAYNPSADKWKLHIVQGIQQHASDHVHGKWIVESNYDPESDINMTKLWHTLKPRVEVGEIPAIRMECPGPKQSKEIHILTADAKMTQVGKKIIPLLKSDITYVVGGGAFRNDRKTLYWNDGNPGYDRGSQESWRKSS